MYTLCFNVIRKPENDNGLDSKSKQSRSFKQNLKRRGASRNDNMGQQNNWEEMYYDLQKKFEELLDRYKKQEEVLKIRQATFMRKEARSKEKEEQLINQLNEAVTLSGDTHKRMDSLRGMKESIQGKIKTIQGDTNKLLDEQARYMNNEFEKKEKKLITALELERQKKTSGEKEWQEKSQTLKTELDHFKENVIDLDAKNSKLLRENQRLKIQYKAQEDDREMLAKQVVQVKRENGKLKTDLKQLESDLEQAKSTIQEMNALHQSESLPSPSTRRSSRPTLERATANEAWEEHGHIDPERERKLMDGLTRLRKLLETERKNLKQVRTAHVNVLAERTELEIFLRQCIDDVKHDISRLAVKPKRPTSSMGYGTKTDANGNVYMEDFNYADRQRVMDMLLSKERVLKLLYDKAFPTKPTVSDKNERPVPIVMPRSPEHYEVSPYTPITPASPGNDESQIEEEQRIEAKYENKILSNILQADDNRVASSPILKLNPDKLLEVANANNRHKDDYDDEY
jgi:myosin heavy subunit